MREDAVSEVSCSDLSIAVLILTLFTAFYERDLIIPPHDIAPVRFVIFLELGIELQIFSDSHDDVVWGNTRIVSISSLVPLAFTEVEGADTKSHINDGTLLSRL